MPYCPNPETYLISSDSDWDEHTISAIIVALRQRGGDIYLGATVHRMDLGVTTSVDFHVPRSEYKLSYTIYVDLGEHKPNGKLYGYHQAVVRLNNPWEIPKTTEWFRSEMKQRGYWTYFMHYPHFIGAIHCPDIQDDTVENLDKTDDPRLQRVSVGSSLPD